MDTAITSQNTINVPLIEKNRKALPLENGLTVFEFCALSDAVAAGTHGFPIEAIRLYRSRTHKGLFESKAVMAAFLARANISTLGGC